MTDLTKDQAEIAEKQLIKEYDATNPQKGYNIELGGCLSGKMTEEMKMKISRAHKGKKASEETRKKLRLRTGSKNGFYGKHHTKETKRVIGLKNSQKSWKGKFGKDHNKSIPCFCIETNKMYYSTREAERNTGIDHSSIIRCCKGKQNIAGGYHWKYYVKDCA
jgi:hypothetical protein